ncbi:response regulator [Chloroflexota bacterium]
MRDTQPDQLKGNILIVDDALPSLQVLSTMLTGQGYTVCGASNGPTALMIAGAEPPDLILLDIMMPEMDGYEVCQQLKSQAQTRDIPVIFISGMGEVTDKVKGFEMGGVDYIAKPCQDEEVVVRVQTHLALYKLQNELEQRVKERTAELAQANASLKAEIAERKQVEESLRESEGRLRTVIDYAPVVLWAIDKDGFFTFSEGRILEDLGLQPGEAVLHLEYFCDFPSPRSRDADGNCPAVGQRDGRDVPSVIKWCDSHINASRPELGLLYAR